MGTPNRMSQDMCLRELFEYLEFSPGAHLKTWELWKDAVRVTGKPANSRDKGCLA